MKEMKELGIFKVHVLLSIKIGQFTQKNILHTNESTCSFHSKTCLQRVEFFGQEI